MNTRPNITFSSAAVNEIKRLKSQHVQPDAADVKLSILSGGCMEWYYDLSFTAAEAASSHYPVDPTNEADLYFVLSEPNQSLIEGLHIDYSEDLMGGGFRFSNPQAKQTCGCGNSFSIQDVPVTTDDCLAEPV
ncbi:MAG: iron-sulfur cluster assembly accessory protein [Leptolyngbyaceae bacterium]|nr:iron-sulfur cluster assembly accessory protein [Leptolyngbyaceae bacterium]